MRTPDLVSAVKAHAEAHYEDGGWDVVVEAWEDSEIAEALERDGITTPAAAIRSFADLVDVYADRQADARVEGADWTTTDAGARRASQRAVTLAADPGPDSDNGLGDDHEMFCYCDECIERKRERS